jgi:hypothetical protein
MGLDLIDSAEMTTPTKEQETIAMWGLLGIGLLLLVIAIFSAPIGASPDSGVVDLGSTGTKWLLGGLGAAFLLSGFWVHFKK